MTDDVWIIGTHMTKFGRHADRDVIDLAHEAASQALRDAQLTMSDVGVVACGNVYESTRTVGQRLVKQLGQTGAPVYNVTNACATGASAVRIGHLAIKAGETDVALAVGVEKMGKAGLLGPAARENGDTPPEFERTGRYGNVLPIEGHLGSGLMPAVFGQAGMDYARRHDVTFEQFAKVAEKNHRHSTLNPLAQYQKAFSLEEVMAADMVGYPNTLLMCCPTGDGAAAVVLVSDRRLQRMDPDVRRRAVKLSASVLTSDPYVPGADDTQPDINELTRLAAAQAYELAGVGPEDLDLIELHDCFATAELLHYDNLGLCEPGAAGEFIDRGGPERDGRTPVNVSGGLISKGHPLGATGVANLYEVTQHLRGEAGDRQVEGARVGLTHVIGLGSACGIHVLERRG